MENWLYQNNASIRKMKTVCMETIGEILLYVPLTHFNVGFDAVTNGRRLPIGMWSMMQQM